MSDEVWKNIPEKDIQRMFVTAIETLKMVEDQRQLRQMGYPEVIKDLIREFTIALAISVSSRDGGDVH